MKLNQNLFAFTGGGTAGHIYPGLAVADEVRTIAKKNNINIQIEWIGCSKGMDKKIAESGIGIDGKQIVNKFYGIPSGKLRRYFSFQNFTDIFRIIAGFFKSYHILLKTKPFILFSKGGFVSVGPCFAARLLKIPVFTHECDFTLGLANKINFLSAKKMFVSYEETKNQLSKEKQEKVIVAGNPVRPVFYDTNANQGRKFLGLGESENSKPILLVLGGSLGAKQINSLIYENIDFLCENFIVVHQTGLVNADDNRSEQLASRYPNDYLPYNFIYEQMPNVVSCADVILSRSGANSIWEAAVLNKPMILIPLCGSGTRGDQVDNALYFKEKNAAEVLIGSDADSEHLIDALKKMLDKNNREMYKESLKKISGKERPSQMMAEYIYSWRQ